MEYTADQIAKLRSFLGISQNDFAKSINYSRSYVKDIESGRVKPSRGFLEALRSKYGVSIDALLSNLGVQIIAGLNAHFLTSDKGFIYLYDFTDSGLDAAEQKLLEFLNGKKFKIVDGRKVSGRLELFAELSGSKERADSEKHFRHFVTTGNNDFIVLKRFSESPIKSQVWGIYRDMARYMQGSLIVLDKPAYLEKYIERLYYSAFPIHFKDSFGFAHQPYQNCDTNVDGEPKKNKP
ncbi:MAG: helix-turn-helix domain-containing protein [Syntrophales bacterium]